MTPDDARKALQARFAQAADDRFRDLLQRLQDALAARDRHGIVNKLEELGLHPLSAQGVEHMLCEFRKLALPEKRPPHGEAFDGYAKLWEAVAPIVAKRGRAPEHTHDTGRRAV